MDGSGCAQAARVAPAELNLACGRDWVRKHLTSLLETALWVLGRYFATRARQTPCLSVARDPQWHSCLPLQQLYHTSCCTSCWYKAGFGFFDLGLGLVLLIVFHTTVHFLSLHGLFPCAGGVRLELANETLRCMHTAADTQLLLAFLQQQVPQESKQEPERTQQPAGGAAAQHSSVSVPSQVREAWFWRSTVVHLAC